MKISMGSVDGYNACTRQYRSGRENIYITQVTHLTSLSAFGEHLPLESFPLHVQIGYVPFPFSDYLVPHESTPTQIGLALRGADDGRGKHTNWSCQCFYGVVSICQKIQTRTRCVAAFYSYIDHTENRTSPVAE